ncbi:putative transmembrane GTPase FZO-like, chloroplastic [Senna tora]|uniref:Putative transmembrane GTPase FZO-like, chloroplastic n=1 Tax=Senna tora TaxID=362788 RepID=A0A834W0V2_9FABA|nr:putative transmembrane GTPase FZO-like, chloroplastic [Senna tora]
MVPLLSNCTSLTPSLLAAIIPRYAYFSRSRLPLRRPQSSVTSNSLSSSSNAFDQYKQQASRPYQKVQPRTLYPGGYKRPEIRVPSLVLQLDPNEVLSGGDALNLIDKAVSKWVGIVVLTSCEASGARLYEAACLLKSVVQDRAYLLISERVDIAAAAGASGVMLSDQGLPTIVARNTMLDSKSESVALPLVARIVQNVDDAVNASKSEGADCLIYDSADVKHVNLEVSSIFKKAKIPIFIMCYSSEKDISYAEASNLITSGASGFVINLESFGSFDDEFLHKLFDSDYTNNKKALDDHGGKVSDRMLSSMDNDFQSKNEVMAGFIKLEDREKHLIETERSVLNEAINVIKKAAPLMEDVSLLDDAVSQIDEPFLLVIVGEFNSGKSTVINALLGQRYLNEGVIPTTNEITFLRYMEVGFEEQRCERHPDGQYICYLPAPILKEMTVVDTPGTNVILQRQQRLTEEFVPRADLLVFVISADRPLTGSEVAFLRYSQQWKKKVVFVLNKSDIYQNPDELEAAMAFIKDNVKKLLNTEDVILFPVSARYALEAKLVATSDVGKHIEELSVSDRDSHYRASSFNEFEKFLYSFLDGSTIPGMERMRLKLETPIAIADKLISACDTLVTQDCLYAKQDLTAVDDVVNSVNDFAVRMETESLSWRRQILSLIETTKSNVVELVEDSLVLSNLDIAASYVFKGEKSAMPATSRIQNDIIGPSVAAAQKILGEYENWIQSKNTDQGRFYKESFEKRWPSLINANSQIDFETYELLKKVDQAGSEVIENFSSSAASKSFEQEIREMFVGAFGGLGVAGLSASLLTSVLQTTLEDLLALGLCSAGGYLAISSFPARRQNVIDKVRKKADALARDLEEAMKNDLMEATRNLDTFVKILSKPYQDQAQNRLDKLLEIQEELSNVEKKIRTLQIEIQNLHVS